MLNNSSSNPMKFIHWSRKPIQNLETRKYKQAWYRPNGIWFSVGNSWIDWCVDNQHGNSPEVDYSYELTFNNYNILTISTLEDVKNTHMRYITSKGFDWTRVYEDYDGFVIYNFSEIAKENEKSIYQNEYIKSPIHANIKYSWFYGLDCSCGCIWNLDAIQTWKKFN